MLDDYVTHAVDKVKMLAYVFIDLWLLPGQSQVRSCGLKIQSSIFRSPIMHIYVDRRYDFFKIVYFNHSIVFFVLYFILINSITRLRNGQS